MKILEAKEDFKPQYRISSIGGKRKDRVAMFREKDANARHGIYRTNGGAYYNRYNVEDVYGEGDELNSTGAVGPFKTEEEARNSLKNYRPNVVEESMGRRNLNRRTKR